MVVKERGLTFEVRADQATSTVSTGTSNVPQQDVSTASQTTPRPRLMDPRYQSNSMPSLLRARSGDNSRSKKPTKQATSKKVVNNFKHLEHRAAALEIKKKGGQGSPQQPKRRMSIILPKAA